jgi:hypothetical protein
MTKLREMKGTDGNGKPVSIKLPPTFGLRRTVSPTILHNGVLRDTQSGSGIEVKEGVIHYFALSNLGKPLSAKGLTLDESVGVHGYRLKAVDQEALFAFAKQAIEGIGTSGSFKGRIQGDYAEARSLVASKPECIPCHKASRVGDPLAIIVFRIEKQ